MDTGYLVRKFIGSIRRFLLFLILIAVFLLLGVGLAYFAFGNRDKVAIIPASPVLPETGGDDESEIGNNLTQKLTVNAQLQVNGQFYLAPSELPENVKAGTLVFDQATNTMQYYNGATFIPLTAQQPIPPSGVTSLQGQTGAVNLVAGSGITINGTTISANAGGLTAVSGTVGQVNVVTANGVATVSLPQSIAPASSPTFAGMTLNGDLSFASASSLFVNNLVQTSPGQDVHINAGNDDIIFTSGGRVFQFPGMAGSPQTICTTTTGCPGGGGGNFVELAPVTAQSDSSGNATIFVNDTGGGNLIQLQSGGVDRFMVSNSGNVAIGGSLTLGSALSVANGGTGRTVLAGDSLLLGNGTGAINNVTNGSPGECLIATAGAPVFATCTGDGVGMTSLTVAGSSGTPQTITDGNTITIAAGTNITTTAGATDTVTIATIASPNFTSLTLGTALGYASGGTNATTAQGAINNISGLTTNGDILYHNGTNATRLARGTNGQCLLSTGTTIQWSTCTGAGGVSSVNSFTGAITVQGTTNQIIVNNNSGVITLSTPQDINTSSSPTFAALTLGSALTVANGGTNATTQQGAINNLSGLTTNGDLLYHNGTNAMRLARGTNGQCLISNGSTIQWDTCTGDGVGMTGFTLQGSSGTPQSIGDGDTVTIAGGTGITTTAGATGLVTIAIDATVCTIGGNCAGVGGVGDILNGGNAGAVTVGSNDNTISLEANGVTYYTISASGLLQGANGSTFSVPGSGSGSEAFGANAIASNTNSIALGNSAESIGARSIAIGFDTDAVSNDSIAIGSGANADFRSVSIGGASSSLDQSVALGHGADATATYAMALGISSSATFSNSVAFGQGATTTASNQFVLGGGFGYSDFYFGNGVARSTPLDIVFNATGGSGIDVAGADFTLAGGRGTGSGNGGAIYLQTAPAGSSGSSLNTLITRLTVEQSGNIIVGQSDTAGSLFVLDTKTDSGDPSGVNGGVYYNSNSGKFRCYEGGAWKDCIFDATTGLTLQAAYNNGNSITTTNSRNILFTLDNTATDSNFVVNIASGSGSAFKIQDAGSDRLSIDSDNAIFTQNLSYINLHDYAGGGGNDLSLQIRSDSQEALLIQNVAGGTLMSVNGNTARITLGTSDTTGQLLVLDTKTDSGDPTGVNGGMYYNSNLGRFRCYQSSAWTDCIGSGSSLFTDAGAYTYLTSTSDNLVVGSSSASTPTAKLAVIGTSNQSQLYIQANATQTSPLVLFENSSGNEIARLHTDANSLYFGYQAGQNDDLTTNYNTGVGRYALSAVTTGIQNTAFGAGALRGTGTGVNNNVAVGYEALLNNTGSQNIAIGNNTVGGNSTGSAGNYNTGLGHQALDVITSGNNNTALGAASLGALTSGSGNIAIGQEAGDNLTSGSGNIILGTGIDFASATGSNQLNIAGLIQSTDYSTGALSMSTSGAGAINIGTGTSTGAINIGNTASGAISLNSSSSISLAASGGTDSITVGSVIATTISTFRFQNGGQVTTPANGSSFSQSVALRTGNAGGSTGSGTITIQTGNGTGTNINSGDIIIDAGSATGTAGEISIGATNSSSIVLGRTGGTINFGDTALANCTLTTVAGVLTCGAGGAGDVLNGGNTGAITIGSNNSTLALEANGTSYYTLSTAGLLQGSNGASISVPGAGSESEQFGAGATALDDGALAVGYGASADFGATALGHGASAATHGTAIGSGSEVDSIFGGQFGVAVGSLAYSAEYGVALGHLSSAYIGATALGVGAVADGSNSIAIGDTSNAGGTGAISLGYQAGGSSTGDYNILMGYQAGSTLTSGASNIIIGAGQDVASATGNNQLNIAGLITSSNYNGGGNWNGDLTVNGISSAWLTLNSSASTNDSTLLFTYQGGPTNTYINADHDSGSLTFGTNGSPALTIASGGAVTLQNATDSDGAFRVTNAAGNWDGIRIDTVNNLVGIGMPGWTLPLDPTGAGTSLWGHAGDSQEVATSILGRVNGRSTGHQKGIVLESYRDEILSSSGWHYTGTQFRNWGHDLTATTSGAYFFGTDMEHSLQGASGQAAHATNMRLRGSYGAQIGSVYGLDAYNEINGTVGTNRTISVGAYGSGTVTDNYAIYVENQTLGTNDYGLYIQGADTYALWVDAGTVRFDGNVVLDAVLPAGDNNTQVCRASTGVLSTCTSSQRFKTDVLTLGMGLNELRMLNPVTYTWTTNGQADVGFIAEQVASVIPQAVTYNANGEVASFNPATITALLTSAVKELDLKVQAIETRLARVEQGYFAGNITVGGKIISAGNAATAVLGSHASGSSAIAISGNDIAGTITYTTGVSGMTTGEQMKIVFSSSYSTQPRVTLTPSSASAAAVRYYVERTTTEFTIHFIDTPATNSTYKFDYQVIQ